MTSSETRPPREMSATWQGTEVLISVLHSRAAVGTQVLVKSRKSGALLLVDVGDGCLRDLIERGVDLRSLKGVLFTHTHYDHCGGLFSLLSFLTVVCRRHECLPVFTPPVCDEVEGQLELWQDVFAHRRTFDAEHHRLSLGARSNVDDFTFTVLEAGHPSSEATSRERDGVVTVPPSGERGFIYLVQVGRERILVCLDSGVTGELQRLVRSADLVLLEATLSSESRRLAQIHMTEDEARALARDASSYLLVHRPIDSQYFSVLTSRDS